MKQYQERNYATRQVRLQKGDIKEYSNRNQVGKTSESGCCNCLCDSKETKEEIGNDNEEIRKEYFIETHQEGRSRVPCSDQGRCKVEETDISKTKGEEMKKESAKEKKHEAKESKSHEKNEEKKPKKSKQ